MAGASGASPPPPPPPPPVAAAALLLLGPASSGRSALLFRAALAACASPPGRALFLAPRPLQRLPGRAPATAPPPGALQRIQFLYPGSLRELLQLLASLHETWPGSSPSLILLDSLEEYLAGCPGPHAAAQLVALLLDTANHFGRKCNAAEPPGCQLVVSVRLPGEGGDGGEQLLAVQRYFPAQCWLRPEAPEGGRADGQGATKQVRARLSQPGAEDQEWLLRFEPQEEEMKISRLPCPGDGGVASGRPSATETHRILDLWWWS